MSTTTQTLPRRYRDAELVARGAMGDVYRAVDRVLGRVVAVKVLADAYVDDEPARRRFAREARAAARLSGDPGIVTIYDVAEAGGRPCIVMEFIGGGSLEELLRERGAQSPDRALRWLEQAAGALDRAHARGVVHRDVKPGNLLLDEDGNVYVADFGIASAAGMASLTATGTVLGTAGYLAPEQAAAGETSPASDRYALGVVAYELLTGRRPFASESTTAEAAAHINAPVPPVGGNLPPALDGVFARALAKRPEERYATCTELVAALRAAFDEPSAPTRVLAGPPTAPTLRTMPGAQPVRRRRATRPAWPLLAAAAGAATLVAVVLAVVLTGGSPKSKPRASTKSAPATHPAAATTTQAATTTTASPATTQAVAPASDAHSLNDRAWALMQQGSYSQALPLLQQAVSKLSGAGPTDPYEAYANYNLGLTLLQLGRCAEAQPYLEHAQALEPDRHEVHQALDTAKHCLDAKPKPKRKSPPEKHD